MNSWFGKLIFPLLVIAILFFIGNAYVTYKDVSTLKSNDYWIDQTNQVTNALEKTQNLLVDAETGQRGYLSNNDTTYLEPYTNALPLVSEELKQIKMLTANNDAQQNEITVLMQEAQTRLGLLKQGIALKDNGQSTPEELSSEEIKGKAVMDSIRMHIHTMEKQETALLRQREQITAWSYETIYFALLITTFFSIFFVISVYTLLQKELQKRDEIKKAVEAKEAHFRLLADIMPQQVWTATPDGLLDYVNIQTTEYFGKTESEIIGAGWQAVIHPDDLSSCIKAWTHALRTGKLYEIEFRLREKTGIYKWHLGRAKPLLDNGKITKWFGTNTDIDEKRQLERQKSDFVSIATHELKTPVTSVKAFAEVLQRKFQKSGDTLSATQLGKMNAQMDKLTSLIADMLDATKIDEGQLRMHEEAFSFDGLIAEIVEEMQRTTTKHTISITGKTKMTVVADRERTGQVITNLISNAIKYSPHTDRIVVIPTTTPRAVQLCVQDFGIGITKEKKQKVFERFYRVSGPKDNTFPGLGLGLYISSQLIKRQGGRIWVESTPDKGSTFCFTLPLKRLEKAVIS